jgi:hypothetical protein
MATEAAKQETLNMNEIRTPEHQLRMKAGRTIGRGVWLATYKADNPGATKAEIKAAKATAKLEFTKIGMRALKTLEKNGFEVVEKSMAGAK